jgi:hypothetical protein
MHEGEKRRGGDWVRGRMEDLENPGKFDRKTKRPEDKN